MFVALLLLPAVASLRVIEMRQRRQFESAPTQTTIDATGTFGGMQPTRYEVTVRAPLLYLPQRERVFNSTLQRRHRSLRRQRHRVFAASTKH